MRLRLSSMAACALALLFVLLGAMPAAQAHESRPAYLEIKESAPGQYTVLWRTPVLAGRRLPLLLSLPEGVTEPEAARHSGTQRFAHRAPLDRRRSERAGRPAH